MPYVISVNYSILVNNNIVSFISTENSTITNINDALKFEGLLDAYKYILKLKKYNRGRCSKKSKYNIMKLQDAIELSIPNEQLSEPQRKYVILLNENSKDCFLVDRGYYRSDVDRAKIFNNRLSVFKYLLWIRKLTMLENSKFHFNRYKMITLDKAINIQIKNLVLSEMRNV